MELLTSGAYEQLIAKSYKYASIIDVKNENTRTILVIRPFKTMYEADTRQSIMGIDDSLIAGAVQGNKQDFSIHYVL